jgi:hypothetical protein
MFTHYPRILPVVFFIIVASPFVRAQEKNPEAYLRISSAQDFTDADRGNEDNRFYYVEIYMPIKLKQEVYDQLPTQDQRGTGSRIGAIALGNEELPYPLQVSPIDCATDASGNRVCARTHFRIYLPKSIDSSKSYQVFFDSYPIDAGSSRRFRAINVNLDYNSSIFKGNKMDLGGCPNRIALVVNYDDEGNLDTQKKTPLRFQSERDREVYGRYARLRIIELHNWVSRLNQSQLDQIEMRVRPLNTLIRPPAELKAVEKKSGLFMLPDGQVWQPTEADLPRLRVTKIKPAQATAALAADSRFLLACFNTEGALPNEDFNVKVAFKNGDVLPELKQSLIKTGMSGNPLQASPGKPDDTKVGQRLIERDLDAAITFGSSVEDKQKPNPNPNISTPVTVRERTTRGTLDLRLAPAGIRSFINIISAPGLGNNATTGRTSAHYVLVTPFFIDAKVSTGKIVKDTLSLNRIVLGTQGEYQYIYNNETFPTYLRFIGRFSSASDRDFKQAEYKGTFEFRPVLSFLNHPLVSLQAAQNQVIMDEGNKNAPLTIISFQKGGYEFVPFFGGEIGRTYARRNPAPAIKPSDTVKRLYVGMDITLNPFKRTTLTASDIFYFNQGSKQKPRANYFITSASFLLGKFFDNPQVGHSLFVSFERGQQPPFDGPGVNAVKIGYRIQADRIFSPLGTR